MLTIVMNYAKLFKNNLKDIDYDKTFRSEREFVDWFSNNCHLLGCKILSQSKNRFPDAIIQKDNNTIRTEFETLSSNFCRHRHDPDKVDLVICICNDEILVTDTLELPFDYSGPVYTDRSTYKRRINILDLIIRKIKRLKLKIIKLEPEKIFVVGSIIFAVLYTAIKIYIFVN